LKVKPDYAAAHSNLALCLVRLNRYDEAVREYEEALRLDPTNTDARNGLTYVQNLQRGAAPPP